MTKVKQMELYKAILKEYPDVLTIDVDWEQIPNSQNTHIDVSESQLIAGVKPKSHIGLLSASVL